MTKNQIDRLGVRLRAGDVSETDLRLLDEYRRSFADAYDTVMGRLRDEFGLEPTGRAAKTNFAIVGKLRRESVRLSQIQDIAGCRIVVHDTPAQDEIVATLASAFEAVTVIDRRQRPSHGYRAVHLVVADGGVAVEIQVRTTAQQLWAEISEKLSDRFGIEVKYGGGGENVRAVLDPASDSVKAIGRAEAGLAQARRQIDTSPASAEVQKQIDDVDRTLDSVRATLRFTLDLSSRMA